MNQEQLKSIKEKYPSETKIKLLKDMVDEKYPVKAGTIGVVDYVDDIGSLHMRWENGSSLALLLDKDTFEIISYPEKIKVIIVEPNKQPYPKEIYNTLRAKQEIVDGLIQCVPSYFSKEKTFDFIVNDEGKINGLPFNRFIYNYQDLVCGTMIVAKADLSTGEFVTIDEQEEKFLMDKISKECPSYTPIKLKEILSRDEEEREY